jgi:hypothetical protein
MSRTSFSCSVIATPLLVDSYQKASDKPPKWCIRALIGVVQRIYYPNFLAHYPNSAFLHRAPRPLPSMTKRPSRFS